MTLFWDHTGPLLKYQNDLLWVKDLNPEIETCWRMSRRERLLTGLRFIFSALVQK